MSSTNQRSVAAENMQSVQVNCINNGYYVGFNFQHYKKNVDIVACFACFACFERMKAGPVWLFTNIVVSYTYRTPFGE